MNSTTPSARRLQAARIAGVYLVTPDVALAEFAHTLRVIEVALAEGVSVVQFRNKPAVHADRLRAARELVRLVQAAGALAIINDDLELAVQVGADGAHVGRDDVDPIAARERIGDRLLGVSCYDDLDRAARAADAGADAIAFGSMFASGTKPAAVRAPLARLSVARQLGTACRVIAIGGINATNIASVAAAGAHAAAIIGAVFNSAHPRSAVRHLIEQFSMGSLIYESQRAAV